MKVIQSSKFVHSQHGIDDIHIDPQWLSRVRKIAWARMVRRDYENRRRGFPPTLFSQPVGVNERGVRVESVPPGISDITVDLLNEFMHKDIESAIRKVMQAMVDVRQSQEYQAGEAGIKRDMAGKSNWSGD